MTPLMECLLVLVAFVAGLGWGWVFGWLDGHGKKGGER